MCHLCPGISQPRTPSPEPRVPSSESRARMPSPDRCPSGQRIADSDCFESAETGEPRVRPPNAEPRPSPPRPRTPVPSPSPEPESRRTIPHALHPPPEGLGRAHSAASCRTGRRSSSSACISSTRSRARRRSTCCARAAGRCASRIGPSRRSITSSRRSDSSGRSRRDGRGDDVRARAQLPRARHPLFDLDERRSRASCT